MREQVGARHAFEALNGLRGIAAIAVMNAHLSAYFAGIRSPNVGLAVDFFFLLSGFVIAHAYSDRLASGMGVARFMATRVIRLYPLYLLGLIIGAAVVGLFWMQSWTKGIASVGFGLLFLPPPPSLSANSYNLFPFNFAAWSLFFELAANLVYAALAPRLTRRVLAILIAASFVGLIAVGLHFGTLDKGVRPEGFLGGLARVMFSFFAGVALYRLWLVRPMRVNLHPLVLYGLLIAPLLIKPAEPYLWPYELAVIAIYFPLLLWFGAPSQPKGVWMWSAAALGTISYPLYVLHAPLWDVFKATSEAVMTAAAPWSGLILLCVLLVACWALETYIDLPLRRWLNRRLLGAGRAREATQKW